MTRRQRRTPPPRETTLLAVAVVTVSIAATALVTRPDMPPALVNGFTTFGSILLGVTLIVAAWLNRSR